MRQRYFDVPFALSGDQTAIPDPLQAGGTVSFTEGWNFNYQRDLTTDPAALPIDRSTMNWLFYQITRAIAALQLGTIPEWITASQNGGTQPAYGKGSEVLYSASGNPPFVKYVSLIDNNTDTPGATGNWQVVADAIATSAQASAGTDNTTIMTPARVAQQDALRALLAGSITQVFNVAPGSGTQAPQFQQVNPGRLLRRSVFVNAAGTQQVSVDGGAFTSTGATTWTPLSNTTMIHVQGQGGGGAGGGTIATNASQISIGGGGSAGAHGRYYGPNPGTQSVSIGAGGTGVSGGIGNNGTSVTFGALLTFPGGSGGNVGGAATNSASSFNFGAQPSSQPTGTNVYGAAGMAGGDANYTLGVTPKSGNGGTSPYGCGGYRQGYGAGAPANGYGAGGSGACANVSTAAQAGGNGSAGFLIVEEYA